MNFNDYSILLLVTGFAAFFMSAVIFRRNGDAVRQFAYITFGISIWAIAYSFELASPNYSRMIFWLKIEYIGVAFLPAMWIQFIIKFIGKTHWLNPTRNALLYIIPSITFIAVLTNNYHHLHYSSINVDNLGPFPLLEFEVGPIYIIHTIFFYINLVAGLYLLINKFANADKVYRRQNYVIILGVLIPWLVNILYLFGIRPYKHIDLTPYAFITTCLVIGFGLLQLKLFDIIPVARDRIIEDLPEGVLVLDAQNRAVDFNAKLRSIVRDDLKSSIQIGDLYPSIFINIKLLVEKVTNKEKTIFELEINDKYYEVTIAPLLDKASIYSGVILIHRDVTERRASDDLLKKQSKELLDLNQHKDKMFSIIAHDLRVPVMNLKEIMSLFDQKLISDEELKSHLPLINTEIKTTSTLLENLLYWSRTQLKGERINPDYINLRLITIVQLSLLEIQIKEKNLLVSNLISENATVYADKNMIELVIRNIISNAIKYCNTDDSITISARIAGDNYIIEIADSGIGIEEKNIAKLFGMNNFSTIGTNSERGTGIGLLLCKEFIEKNNGSIWVKSEIGKGSTFGFSLPIQRNS